MSLTEDPQKYCLGTANTTPKEQCEYGISLREDDWHGPRCSSLDATALSCCGEEWPQPETQWSNSIAMRLSGQSSHGLDPSERSEEAAGSRATTSCAWWTTWRASREVSIPVPVETSGAPMSLRKTLSCRCEQALTFALLSATRPGITSSIWRTVSDHDETAFCMKGPVCCDQMAAFCIGTAIPQSTPIGWRDSPKEKILANSRNQTRRMTLYGYHSGIDVTVRMTGRSLHEAGCSQMLMRCQID
jgi:hypothetical protein